jgi:hypothetical protein
MMLYNSCEYCKEEFEFDTEWDDKDKEFCSELCCDKWSAEHIKCPQCYKMLKREQADFFHGYCSVECYEKTRITA